MSSTQSKELLQKRRHKTLSIQEKVQVLELLELGTSVKRVCNIFNVGSSTVYDIRRKKEVLLKFHEKQSKKGMPARKTMKVGKCNDVERALAEWFELRKSEGIAVTGGMIIEQAKIFQKKINPNFKCKYSQGWLEKFKNRHGIKLYAIDYEKVEEKNDPSFFSLPETTDFSNEDLISHIDSDAVEDFIKKFTNTVSSEEFNSEQIYSASQTMLQWRQLPKEIFTSQQDSTNSSQEFQDSEDQIAVFSCFNATGSHRCKLLVVGKSTKPKALNGLKVSPVIFRSNERNCVTKEILIDWLENHFTTEAETHCTNLGFAEHSKILLVVDSSLAPSNEELLVIDNVYLLFLSSSYSIYIQPQEQEITHWLKCWYRLECLANFLEAVIQQKTAETFRNEFNIRDCAWTLARAWENISEIAFRRSWQKLWPEQLYDDPSEAETEDFYMCYKEKVINPIVNYAKSINKNVTKYICHENLEEWLQVGDEVLFDDYQPSQMNQGVNINIKKENDREVNDLEGTAPTVEDCITLTTKLISGLEKQDFIAESEIMHLYRLKVNLITEKFVGKKSPSKKRTKCASAKKGKNTS